MTDNSPDLLILYQTQLRTVLDISTNEYTELHIAVKKRRLRQIDRLLNEGTEIEPHNCYGITPLHLAAAQGDIDAVELLLNKGASVKPECCAKFPPMMFAVAAKNKSLIELFIKRGCDINELVDQSFSYLHYWVRHNNIDMVKFLLKLGIDINILDCESATPLCIAVRHNIQNMIEFLLDRGASVNDFAQRNNSALLQSINMDNADVFQQLCSRANNFDDQDRKGRHLLRIAMELRNYTYMRDMLEMGANPTVVCDMGLTVLHYAIRVNDYLAAYMLCEFMMCLNKTDVVGKKTYASQRLRGILKNEANYNENIEDTALSPFDFALLYNNDCLEPLLLAITGFESEFKGQYIEDRTFDLPRIVEYHVKRNVVGLPVYHRCLPNKVDRLYRNFIQKCQQEVLKLQETIMFRNVSYYKFIRGNRDELTSYSRREDVAKIFEDGTHEELFPIYKHILYWKYVCGRRFIVQLDKAIQSLNTLFSGQLPKELIENIVIYLNYSDVKRVKKAITLS